MTRRYLAVLPLLIVMLQGCSKDKQTDTQPKAAAAAAPAPPAAPTYSTLKLEYAAHQELAPISPGGTLMYDVTPEWKGGSACDPATVKRTSCTIKPNTAKMLFRFKCNDPMHPCDPDILIDDGSGPGLPPGFRRKAATVGPVSKLIAIYCDPDPNSAGQQKTTVDPDDEVRVKMGDTVGWTVIGDAGTGNLTWTLTTIGSGTACTNGSGSITESNPTCNFNSNPHVFKYRVQVTAPMTCNPSDNAVLRDVGPKP